MVENFFPISVDGFFRNPDKIVNYAKSLPKKYNSKGEWPGVRSEPLWEIDLELNTAITAKILACYGLLGQNVTWRRSTLYFQEIHQFSDNKNDVRNRGWIHKDGDSESDYELAGLIYLNPNIDPDSGTSLFNRKENAEEKIEETAREYKKLLYTSKNNVRDLTEDERIKCKEIYEECEKFYIEKTRFQNIFNRMIAYDPCEFHRANNFYHGGGQNENRLTLVFFLGGFDMTREYPLKLIRDEDEEKKINNRLV